MMINEFFAAFINKLLMAQLKPENATKPGKKLIYDKPKLFIFNQREKTMTKVTMTDLKNAHQSKQQLVPAIDALQRITTEAVGCVEDHERITSFSIWLQRFASKADDVIAQANLQYKNRPQNIIQAANTRLHKIPDEILLRQKKSQFATEAYEAQVFDLKHKGFNSGQIAKIVDDPGSEIERNRNEIIELNNEQEHILAFLADVPVFDIGLLKGTALETFLLQSTTE
ncbi:hypothetical protein [Methylobacter tundripaludum]|uniref:hypothetical protein n=1 Tax=Methylobacter tundripaludum TaxID=173365 RepID=UPI0004892E6C|nr:hypothetical protein [Methylobacter tundripaludum]